jgi:hypothetical protein
MATKTTDRKPPDRTPGANLEAAAVQLRQARMKLMGAGNENKTDKVRSLINSMEALKKNE